MQLAAPSLPINASLSSGAAAASDKLSSLVAGNAPATADSFEELMPDSKPAVPATEKTADPAGDRATAEAAVIFSGWLQIPMPADAEPVAVTPDASTSLNTDVTDTSVATTDFSAGCAAASPGGTFGTNPVGAGLVPAAAAKSFSVLSARFAASNVAAKATAAADNGSAAPESVPAANGVATATDAAAVTDPATTAQLAVMAEGPAATVAAAIPAGPVSFSAKATGRVPATAKADGEKFAPARVANGADSKSDSMAIDKNFLNVDEKEVEEEVPALGIDAAKSTGNMSATLSHRTLSSANDRSMLTAFSSDGASATSEVSSGNATADAHRAVDAVVQASERLTTSGQGVNLQFSMGGADLAVRVEMRAGELHATFRTNSPELRAALSSEWHAAAAQDAASPLRMVEPVFASSNSSGTGDYSQSASSQQGQRESNSRETSPGGASFSRTLNGESADDSPSQKDPRQPRSFFGANQHLHAFA